MKDKLLIIGAGGHGKVAADVATQMDKWKTIAFLDDNPTLETSLGLEVIGNTRDIHTYINDYDIFVAIGDNKVRGETIERLEDRGATIPALIHPSAVIGKEVTIESGTIIMAGAMINVSSAIGKGCIINTAATVDHDNTIGDFVHISPGAHLAGTVTVGNFTWLGIGSAINPNLTITDFCIIGAGGVVVKDITEAGTYVGVPVKRIK